MNETNALVTLRETLAFLYDNELDARRIASDASLDVQLIPFSGRAIDNWNAILLQAQKENKTANLMTVSFREFRENEKLSQAWHDYLIVEGKRRVQSTPQVIPQNSQSHWKWISGILLLSTIALTIFLFPTLRGLLGLPNSPSEERSVPVSAVTETSTVQSTPSSLPVTSDETLLQDTLLAPEETWEQEGLELSIVKYEFVPGTLRIWWKIKNSTSQDKLLAYSLDNFVAETNDGHKFPIEEFGAGGYHCSEEEKLLKPGETLKLCADLPLLISVDLTIPNLEYIAITASNISRIPKAQWKIPANFR